MANILQVQVPNGTAAVVWSSREAGVNSLLFINQDLNNTVWLGQASNVVAGGPHSIPLAPNGTFSGDASSNWYVTGSAAGISPLVVVPNGQAYFLGITQGLGNLVIPSIQSPNFTHNVSGWQIKKDGSAEFNNIVIRGSVTIGGLELKYNGVPAANNLVYSNSVTAGTDSFGNAYFAGVTEYGLNGLTYYAVNMAFGIGNGDIFGGIVEVYTGASMAAWTASATFTMGANGIAELTCAQIKLRPSTGTNAPLVASNPNSIGLTESWHDMTLLNSWTTTGYAQYRLDTNDRVLIRGRSLAPGTTTGGTSIWTPPGGYVPSVTQRIEMIIENSTGAAVTDTPRFDILAGGLEVFNIPATTTLIGFNGSYDLA